MDDLTADPPHLTGIHFQASDDTICTSIVYRLRLKVVVVDLLLKMTDVIPT